MSHTGVEGTCHHVEDRKRNRLLCRYAEQSWREPPIKPTYSTCLVNPGEAPQRRPLRRIRWHSDHDEFSNSSHALYTFSLPPPLKSETREDDVTPPGMTWQKTLPMYAEERPQKNTSWKASKTTHSLAYLKAIRLTLIPLHVAFDCVDGVRHHC